MFRKNRVGFQDIIIEKTVDIGVHQAYLIKLQIIKTGLYAVKFIKIFFFQGRLELKTVDLHPPAGKRSGDPGDLLKKGGYRPYPARTTKGEGSDPTTFMEGYTPCHFCDFRETD